MVSKGTPGRCGRLFAGETMNSERYDINLRELSPFINFDAIERRWQALAPPYDVEEWVLPLPVWAHRPFEHSPEDAWSELQRDLSIQTSEHPFCIYIHVPFCDSKCGFCDSYSFKLGAKKEKRIREYVEKICDELSLWSRTGNLAQRPVSTVHLGGGTPTFLGKSALRRIVDSCKSGFNTTTSTEWALEATVASLTSEMIETLEELGFSRLHIGIQSLNDEVRSVIGRRCSHKEALEVVNATLEREWVVSVDMICGLPFQTVAQLVNDVNVLADLGVNGFSLYELLIYPQNRRWAQQYGLTERKHLPNYLMYQVGAGLLEARGYRKNLFNHWADDCDENIYFTFPTRGEDCLAVGTIADGVFGDYHYRHPRYAAYLRTSSSVFPGIEGGLRRNEFENMLHPIAVAILSSNIHPEEVSYLTNLHPQKASAIIDHWLEMELVEQTSEGGLTLTNNGSWFAGNMIAELKKLLYFFEFPN